jgi:hypothetical protein
MSVSQIPSVLPYTFNTLGTAKSIFFDFYVELIKLDYTLQLVKVGHRILDTGYFNSGIHIYSRKKDPPLIPGGLEGDFCRLCRKGQKLLDTKAQNLVVRVFPTLV